MVEKIVYSIKKDGKKSVSAVEKDVAVWTEWLDYAAQVYMDFSEETVLPVSYTHLDVYKRQEF